jgi:hypothetical protein
VNGDNMDNVRREASRTFRKKREYLKHKINELETNRKEKEHLRSVQGYKCTQEGAPT